MSLREELRIQALLDGELTPAEATALRAEIDRSPQLRRIERELRDLIGDTVHLFAALPEPSATETTVLTFRPAALRSEWQRASILRAAALLVVVASMLTAGSRLGHWLAASHDGAPASIGRIATHDAVPRSAAPAPPTSPPAALPADPVPREKEPPIQIPPSTLLIEAKGMQRVAARGSSDATSGRSVYALGATTVVLEYGADAVAGGGVRVDGPLQPDDAPPVAHGTAPRGTSALDRASDHRVAAPADSLCPGGIRWADPSGTELRLSGPFTCRELRRVAARFVVRRSR
jgi:hypothetical protein